MSEKGTAFSTDDRGGLIAPDKPSGPRELRRRRHCERRRSGAT